MCPLLGWRAQGSWGLERCPGPGPVSSRQGTLTNVCLAKPASGPRALPARHRLGSSTLPHLWRQRHLPAVMPEASVVPDLSPCHLTSGHQHILLTVQETAWTTDHPMSLLWTPLNPDHSALPEKSLNLVLISAFLSLHLVTARAKPVLLGPKPPAVLVLFGGKATAFTDSTTSPRHC